MQALGLIETKGLIAAIEGADAMLKAADVSLLEKTIVGAGLVTIAVTGDVAAVKAAVEAGGAAVRMINGALLVSQHVIPRPHEEIDTIIGPGKDPQDAEDPIIEAPIIEEPITEDAVTEAQAVEIIEIPEEKEDALHRKEAVDRLILEYGLEKTIEALSKLKVIELRNLARRYMDFGITGRAVSKADKRLLLAEFRKCYGNK
jgi:microcompartment protein CcmL/EutN